jgi:hypothetical protein
MHPMARTLRWLLLVPATLLSVPASALVGATLAQVLDLWAEPMIGIVASAVFVALPYKLAPSGGLIVSGVALLVGALLAWWLIDPPSYYPEGYAERSYQPTYLPIIGTYGAGLATWVLCASRHWRAE